MLSFPAAQKLLEPLYFEVAGDNGRREKKGRGWSKACNDATKFHFEEFEREGVIRILCGRDYRVVRRLQTSEWYDSGESDHFSAELVAKFVHGQLNEAWPRKADELFVNKDFYDDACTVHKGYGRSESFGACSLLSDSYELFASSGDALYRALAASYKPQKLFLNWDAYEKNYEGDVIATLGNEQIRICCPFLSRHMTIDEIKDFLEKFNARMGSRRYWLFFASGVVPFKELSRTR